jgi:hypothetical protein
MLDIGVQVIAVMFCVEIWATADHGRTLWKFLTGKRRFQKIFFLFFCLRVENTIGNLGGFSQEIFKVYRDPLVQTCLTTSHSLECFHFFFFNNIHNKK